MYSINDAKFLLINVGFAQPNENWNFQKVVSPFTRIFLPQSGIAKIHLPNGSFIVKPGFMYIIPAYCMHNYECTGEFSLYYVHLYENTDTQVSIGDDYDFQNQIVATDLDEALIKYILQNNSNRHLDTENPQKYDNNTYFLKNLSVSRQRERHAIMEVEGILEILLAHFLHYATPKTSHLDNRISKSIFYIRTHIDKPISISELAELACISEEYFIRLFTKQMKISPLQYIQKKKIERAQLLLMIKKISVKELSYSLGFDDVSYFNRVFKKITRMTPLQYSHTLK